MDLNWNSWMMQLIMNDTFKMIYISKENHIILKEIDTLINLKAIVHATSENCEFFSIVFLRIKDGNNITILNEKQVKCFIKFNHFKMLSLQIFYN